MSRGQLLVVVAVCALVGGVMISMCVGLSSESPRTAGHSPDESESRDGLALEHPSTEDEEAETDESTEGEAEPEPVLEGERSLMGIVENRDGDPLPGAEVEVEGHRRLRTLSDEQGEYRIDRVPLQAVTLVAKVVGYAESRVEVDRGKPEGQERRDVTLEGGDGVGGVVVDPDGKPVHGAQVRLVKRPSDELSTDTDRYGRFALPEQAAGREGVARFQGYADSPPSWLEAGARNLLALRRAASIAGAVVGRGGHPIRSYTLTIEGFREAGSESSRGRRYRQRISNATGRFTVRGLAAGSYELSVTTRTGTRSQTVRLEEGQQKKDLRINAH